MPGGGLPATSMNQKKRPDDHNDDGQKQLPLQRRRVYRACELCRRKKIKCDGKEPLCTPCGSSNSQCTWVQTKDRAALSRHYVQELETRLMHMEDVLKQVAPMVELLGNTPNGVSMQALVSSLQQGKANPPNARAAQMPPPPMKRERTLSEASQSPSSSKSGADGDDVSEAFGQLALDERGHLRWLGGSSTMSLIQSFRALTTSPLHRVSPMEDDPKSPMPNANKLYFPDSVFFGKVRALPGPEEVEYPPRDLADKLVDAYFSRLHYLLPVVDKPSFLFAYRQLMDRLDDVDYITSQTAFSAVVFSVFACASRIVDDERLYDNDDAGIGMMYYERALILHYIDHASIQIGHVQCFILLSSFLCAVNCLPQAWLLVGQAVRMAQDLGLHRFSRHLNISSVEKQVRRKVFWGVYSLDRMLALALGRPLGVLDSDCDAEMPIPYDDEELNEYFSGAQMQTSQPSLMSGFIALCELYRIAGRVCQQIYAIDKCRDNIEPEKVADLVSSAQELDKELTQWCDNLPPNFKSSPATESQISMGAVLCSHYYSILITLHRNFLPISPNHQAGPPNSTQKAFASARACIHLAPSVRNVVPSSHHLAFFIQQLFSSAVIELLYAMHVSDKDAAHSAIAEAESCIGYVASWEGTWPGARKCKELLSDLARTAKVAVNKTSLDRQDDSPSSSGPSVPGATPPTSAAQIPSRRSESRSNRGKTARAKSRESRASLNRTTSPYRRRAASSRRPLDGYEHNDAIGGSPSSPSFSAFPPSYQAVSDHKPTIVENQSTSTNDINRRHSVSFVQDPYYGANVVPSSSSSSGGQSLNYSYSQQSQHDSQPWVDPSGSGMYTASSHEADFSTYHSPGAVNTNSVAYANPFAPTTMLGIPGQGESPPTSSFAANGLPFPGLEFIRNYNSGTFDDGQDLWQAFDGGEFRYDPDLPFSFGEMQ